MNKLPPPTCFLFDNGSFRPDSTLALRRVAERLSKAIKWPVAPTSLLHSTRVSADRLDGRPAELLEPALEQFADAGGKSAILLPLFFGPSGALCDYLPPRLDALRAKFSHCEFRLAACLESAVDDSTELIAAALAEQVRRAIETEGYTNPGIIVTDHGSPLAGVTAVRNRVGQKLGDIESFRSNPTMVASMERREGAEYAFNEPLLEQALRKNAEAGLREIVVALQFLFPGRHAGPGGDIADICDAFVKEWPEARFAMTTPIGESDQILQLLERRFEEAITPSF